MQSKSHLIGSINYALNEEENTASVVSSHNAAGQIQIPRIVEMNGKQFRVTSIAPNAFLRNSQIMSIDFPADSEVATIGNGAFAFSSILRLTIPANVIYIGEGILSGAIQLTEIIVSPQNTHVTYYKNKLLICDNVLIYGSRLKKSFTIPSNVTEIAKYSFDYHAKLTKITFKQDSQLKKIGLNAFDHTSLKSFTIPANVEFLELGCFFGANQLVDLELSPKNHNFIFYEKCLLIQNDVLKFARKDIKQAVIPPTVKSIAKLAFEHCSHLVTVTFQLSNNTSSLLEIGQQAFSNCSELQYVLLPPSIKRIDDFAFNCCTNLRSIGIQKPNGVLPVLEYIGHSAFCQCANLEEVPPIPASVLEVGRFCFSGSILSSVVFLGSEIHIGSRAFFDCPNLKKASFPNAKTILVDAEAFSDVSKEFEFNHIPDALISGDGAPHNPKLPEV